MTGIIYKSRLSVLYLGFAIVGAVFFGTWVYVISKAKWTAAPGTDAVVARYLGYCILFVFAGFAALCIVMALLAKQFVLTTDSLYVKRPLLFNSRCIGITEMQRITSTSYAVGSSYRLNNFTIYEGRQATIHLASGACLRLNSLEIGDYYTCVARLQNALRRYEARLNYVRLQRQDRQWQGYQWLLLAMFLTGGLLVSTFL